MQSEVMRLLKKENKPMTSSQVSTRLKINRNLARNKLNKLAKFKMVKKTAKRVKYPDQHHLIFLYRAIR